ncbi:MAG TPA: sigma-54 dependent transcriptional regulator [Chitinivibrionales bacterium]|jgi:DNA-binding NtrC family response regulator|nr:sigma-54 dependent transcriptional regulator [Chitinivibrionales bacterium]
MRNHKLLLVEDDEAALFGYERYLSKNGFETRSAASLADAKNSVAQYRFDAIVLDLKLPDGYALDWLPELKQGYPHLPVIVITGSSDIPTAVKATKNGAEDFLTKPVEMTDLLSSLQKALEIGSLRKLALVQNRLVKQDEPYFGTSPAITEAMEHAAVAAANDTVVLILGETGTGKGVLAKWIHNQSDRKSEAFVEVNCSSLKGELLRSELFGHVKGAFTSSIKDREGLIEVADGGTLFLDEIGDMDMEVQTQLLKTIEEKSFRRIGENNLRKSDFRLICATNRDLLKETESGRFRNDLYYRICVFPVCLPALRERKEDVPELCERILRSFDYPHLPLSTPVVQLLTGYAWPGNIRELRNMLERAFLLARGQEITPAHFPGLSAGGSPQPQGDRGVSLVTLEDMEMLHIKGVLDKCAGDKYKASEILGISLSSLYRKLTKTGSGA